MASGREELASFLDLAAQQDGSIRLLKSREADAPGLFPSSKGKYGKYQNDLLGTMLEETLSRPRMVKLTEKGLEVLLRNTPQDERAALISRASDLYRPQLIRLWQKFAVPREIDSLQKTVESLYGKLLQDEQPEPDQEKANLDLAKELALSWSEAETDEARQRLGYFLRYIGAVPFEEENSIVEFTGISHNPIEPLFKGDPALVVMSGWTMVVDSESPIILLKANVKNAP